MGFNLNVSLVKSFRIFEGVCPDDGMLSDRILVLLVFVDRVGLTLVDALDRRATLGFSVTPAKQLFRFELLN
jgi:hypothetical protein